MRLNLSHWFSQVSLLITSNMLVKIYGCFLLGFCIGKNEIYTGSSRTGRSSNASPFRGLAIGLPLNFVYAATFDSGSWSEVLSGTFGILPLSTGYTCLLCSMWLDIERRKRLRHFAPVGRMTLTNYVGRP